MAAPLPSKPSDSLIFLLKGKGVEECYFHKTEQSFKTFLGKDAGRLTTVDVSYVVRDLSRFGKNLTIPGGNASLLAGFLNQTGKDAISKFVHEGGSFIGFCSPCYMVGPSVFYLSKDEPYLTNHGINFSKSYLTGPAIELGAIERLSQHTARAVSVKYGDSLQKKCDVLWNGGGAYHFVDPYTNVVLTRYNEPETQKIAAYCAYGKGGPAVLCNVHPEVQLDEEEALVWCPGMNAEKRAALVASKSAQQELFAEICRYASLETEPTPSPKQKELQTSSASDSPETS